MKLDTKTDGDWNIQLSEIGDVRSLGPLWVELETRADCSIFQSWSWIGAWLEALPSDVRPMLLRVEHRGLVVGLSVLCKRPVRRHGVFFSRALHVSESGDPAHDTLTVEHSGPLVQRGLEKETLLRSVQFLLAARLRWDELFVSGVEHRHARVYDEVAEECGMRSLVRADSPYFYVDLQKLNDEGRNYLSVLSRNSRYQVQRAIREYAKTGPVELTIADSVDVALELFAELRELHQSYWQSRGRPGAFATDFANRFHEILIKARFAAGEIQLLKLSAGPKVFGYLYNFVYSGTVTNYQSGFVYDDNRKHKPGLVSHSMAIEHNLQQGLQIYDFLMGDQQYKRSLATNEERMKWLVLQRQRLRFGVESRLRAMRQSVRRADP